MLFALNANMETPLMESYIAYLSLHVNKSASGCDEIL